MKHSACLQYVANCSCVNVWFCCSWWFSVTVVLLGISVALALFCVLYLDWFKGIQHYDQEYPALAPVTTAIFIAVSCCFNIALWPVWSIFTPVILFTQFMGVLMLISMLG
ncbi:transmembrane protein 128-like [Conger conger]|uniref:transmembrane protein 128-like n=1 Tax=Conger conger TaxID=82655 RepID=UPI002A5B0219|nr:transmembrane protein 128-like [Conger conger]